VALEFSPLASKTRWEQMLSVNQIPWTGRESAETAGSFRCLSRSDLESCGQSDRQWEAFNEDCHAYVTLKSVLPVLKPGK
jgi:hypothetical protein